MPGREHEDASEVIVIPAHLLFAEESNDLGGSRSGWSVYEEVVIEGCHIEEDGFVVEEELGEEGDVLGKELVLLAVDFVDGVEIARVDFPTRWRCVLSWT